MFPFFLCHIFSVICLIRCIRFSCIAGSVKFTLQTCDILKTVFFSTQFLSISFAKWKASSQSLAQCQRQQLNCNLSRCDGVVPVIRQHSFRDGNGYGINLRMVSIRVPVYVISYSRIPQKLCQILQVFWQKKSQLIR